MISNGYRRAALELYGLSDVDRSWVMERLPSEQAYRLSKLINELHALGMPIDQPSLIEMLSGVVDSHQQEPVDGPTQQAELEIESADFSLLRHALDAEPDIVVAQIVGYRNWSWRNPYFETCEPQRRQRIIDGGAQDGAQIRSKVIDALILGLAEKLIDPGVQERPGDRIEQSSRVESGRSFRFWSLLWQR